MNREEYLHLDKKKKAAETRSLNKELIVLELEVQLLVSITNNNKSVQNRHDTTEKKRRIESQIDSVNEQLRTIELELEYHEALVDLAREKQFG